MRRSMSTIITTTITMMKSTSTIITTMKMKSMNTIITTTTAMAVSAKQTNADKNVILVEKLDILSGNGKFDMNFFDNFVARLFPKNVIRCKGLCWFKEEPDMCYLFEQAGKQMELKNAGQWYATMPKDELQQMLEREEGLRRDWDEKYGDRMQKLVFIGQKLDKKTIKEQLDMCLTDVEL